jgi:hypothetical protein
MGGVVAAAGAARAHREAVSHFISNKALGPG